MLVGAQMMNSSVLWGLVAGVVLVVAIGFFRFVLPKLGAEYRKLSEDANSLLAPRATKPKSEIQVAPIQVSEKVEINSSLSVHKGHELVAALSLCLFLVSLWLPALLFEHHEPLRGWEVLAWGWWGVLTFDFAWFANPIYFRAVRALLNRDLGLTKSRSGWAIFLGLLSFFAKEWWFNEGSGTHIVGLGPAFYVWIGSFAVIYIACHFLSWPDPSIITDPSR